MNESNVGCEPRNGVDVSARAARPDLVERLAAGPLAHLSRPSLEALAEVARPCFFRKGETILEMGKPVRSFFVVLAGRVKMFRALESGRNLVLALFHPGDLFGAVAALGGETCDASMVALDATSCLSFDRDGLFALFERRPKLVGEVLPVLTRQLAECRNCIVELTCFRVEVRFAQLLLKLAGTVGQRRSDGTLVPIPLSRQELADMAGTTIETSIRVMSAWARDGLVATRKDGFLIRDGAALEALARG